MTLTGTYKIGESEITDPELTIFPDGIEIFITSGTINVTVLLQRDGVKIVLRLTDVKVNDFNYDVGQLAERIVTRLSDFLV